MNEIASVPGTVTADLVMRVLDAATLRHAAHAANIANASVEGYRAVSVSFEEQLAGARRDLLDRDDSVARRALEALRPMMQTETARPDVQLDREISLMMQNVVRYQALLTALGKSGAILRMAIREGRS